MGIALGKRTQIDNMDYPQPGVDNTAPVPGKQTLTGQLAAQVKGQEHQVCDDPSGECFLDPATRGRLDDDIRANIVGAMAAWTGALANKRMDVLAKHEDGWSTLWKIGGVVAMAAVGEGVGLAVTWLGEAAESVTAIRTAAQIVNREDTVHSLIDFAGEQVLDKVKDKVNEAANETGNAQADFLSTQTDGPHQWGTGLMKSFPKRLDDYGRLLLLGLTSEKVMAAAAFGRRIDELLARWQAQAGDVGKDAGNLSLETVAWVYPRAGGKPRLARVAAAVTTDGPEAPLRAELFRQWVDEDMVSYALDEQARRKLYAKGPLRLADLGGAPTDKATIEWDAYGGEAADAMWPDFGKQGKTP